MLKDTSTDGAIISLNIEILYTYSNKINAKLLQICWYICKVLLLRHWLGEFKKKLQLWTILIETKIN